MSQMKIKKNDNEDWCTEDIIYLVFTFLDVCDLCKIMNVCLVWKNIIKYDSK